MVMLDGRVLTAVERARMLAELSRQLCQETAQAREQAMATRERSRAVRRDRVTTISPVTAPTAIRTAGFAQFAVRGAIEGRRDAATYTAGQLEASPELL